MSVLMKLERVERTYDGALALRGINLDVGDGEILSIIGHNGAGKTTLLRILALLDTPSKGEIIYRGTRVRKETNAGLRREITMVFQLPIIFSSDVFENIAYGLRLRGYHGEEISKKVESALGVVGLNGFGSRKALKLSGGEQQRVVLARALALEPKLLLLDEPTANLDPLNSSIVEKTIKDMGGKTTIVVATHNLFQAKRISDKVGCLLNGTLIDVGSTRDIFNHPKDERTKKFINGEFF